MGADGLIIRLVGCVYIFVDDWEYDFVQSKYINRILKHKFHKEGV